MAAAGTSPAGKIVPVLGPTLPTCGGRAATTTTTTTTTTTITTITHEEREVEIRQEEEEEEIFAQFFSHLTTSGLWCLDLRPERYHPLEYSQRSV